MVRLHLGARGLHKGVQEGSHLMTCLACDFEFDKELGDGEQCPDCGAYDGETDVERIIRVLGEDNRELEERLQNLKELIRSAARAADPESFEANDREIETMHELILGLAAAVEGKG